MAGLPDNSIGVPSAAGLVPGVDIPPQLASALTYNLSQRRGQQAGESADTGVASSEETLDALQLSHLVAHSSQTAPTAQVVATHEVYSQGDQGEAYAEQEFGECVCVCVCVCMCACVHVQMCSLA